MDSASERQLEVDEHPIAGPAVAIAAPVMFAYASHFLLFHRVTERSIELLQRAFPRRFPAERDQAVLGIDARGMAPVLERFVEAGYLEPAPDAAHRDQSGWVVPALTREMLTRELLRYGSLSHAEGGTFESAAEDEMLLRFRAPLLEMLRSAAADTADDEPLIGELSVQLRFASDWAELEQLWYRYGMRIIITDPVATHAAFGTVPEPILHQFPGLWLAHVYVESTSVMQRIRTLPQGEDLNMLVERLSLQVTESTASIGPRWRELSSPDARVHVGVNWMRFQRLRGDFPGAQATLGELQRLFETPTPESRQASDRNRAFFKLEQGILLFFVDRWPEALESLREATLLWQRPGYGDYVPAFALSLMGLMQELRGPRGRAAECLEQAQRIFGEVWDFAYVSVLTVTVEAMLALDRLEVDRARDLLQILESTAPDSELWPIVLRARQWTEVLSDDPAAAARTLEQISGRATGVGRLGPLAVRLVHRVRIESLLAQGQVQRARGVLDGQSDRSPSSHGCWARVFLMGGRYEQALRHVDIVLHDPRASSRDRAEAHLIVAAAKRALGDEAGVDRACAAAVEEMRQACTLLPLATVPPGARGALVERCAGMPGWPELLRELDLTPTEVRSRFASLVGGFPDTALLVDLTVRETELLVLLDQRLTQAEIARKLHLALSTVKKQVAGLYRKLGVESQGAALEQAYRIGLFDGS
ncbi:LuxR C-terminal-related transcriptional regulator [Leucobacter sp. W1153]|uniref:helix-turn-helix transcriptional regulator n=1 Tax=unclassified Leucobacter TaxID=2621730 RepID=UPI003F2E4337